jgi:hypothetical protein
MVRLPDRHADAGRISPDFASQKLLPAKTRVLVDFAIEAFRVRRWRGGLRQW